MRPSHQPSGFSSSPSLRREGRFFTALLARFTWAPRPGRAIVPVLADPYHGVALGVECAWPASLRLVVGNVQSGR